ncbi:MAG: hypothetical protein AB7C89_04460 [Intestinibacillus sp.]
MIELVRQMIVSVTAAAIFSTVMLMIVQKSALHEVIRLATGMLMILALLLPLSRLSLPTFGGALEKIRSQTGQQVTEAQQKNQEIANSSFGGAVSKYIEEKAAAMGIACTVRTTVAEDDAGTLGISRIQVSSSELTSAQRSQISELIERECGVPPERQELVED